MNTRGKISNSVISVFSVVICYFTSSISGGVSRPLYLFVFSCLCALCVLCCKRICGKSTVPPSSSSSLGRPQSNQSLFVFSCLCALCVLCGKRICGKSTVPPSSSSSLGRPQSNQSLFVFSYLCALCVLCCKRIINILKLNNKGSQKWLY